MFSLYILYIRAFVFTSRTQEGGRSFFSFLACFRSCRQVQATITGCQNMAEVNSIATTTTRGFIITTSQLFLSNVSTKCPTIKITLYSLFHSIPHSTNLSFELRYYSFLQCVQIFSTKNYNEEFISNTYVKRLKFLFFVLAFIIIDYFPSFSKNAPD